MPQEPITSLRNNRIVAWRKLTQRKHRQRQGQFLLEGLQPIHMALDAELRPRHVLYCEKLMAGQEAASLLERMTDLGCDLVPVSPTVLRALSARQNPQGLMVVLPLLWQTLGELTLEPGGLVVVCDRLQDPGNMGTIIRTADAVGADAVIMVTPTVDPHDPRCVRATMGSIGNVPLVSADDPPALVAALREAGLSVVGADANQGQPWGDEALTGGVALVLGREGPGLSPDVRTEITDWAALPMRGGAESLNVSVAGGILMYAWLRRNESQLDS